MFLKRFAPKSLFGRFLMIIIVPTVLVQLIATYMFYERHWKSVSMHMSISLSGEIILISEEVDQAENIEEIETIIRKSAKNLGLKSKFVPEAKIDRSLNLPKLPTAFDFVAERLQRNFGDNFLITVVPETDEILAQVELPKGLLSITTTEKRLTNPTTYIFIMWMSGTALILLIVAIIFLKNQVRSITRLAKVAEKFGKGESVDKFKPSGAQEVRQAAAAFIEMKDRIQRHMTQRMEMLAGISHDLRTPLTRMKLQLAMLKESKAAKKLGADVDEMEHMLNEYLDFLRGAGREKKKRLQISTLLEEVVESYSDGKHDISLRIGKDTRVLLRPVAFKRCITNTINNAIKYGTRVVVSADADSKKVRIAIDDNGPGIPKEKHEEVFRPFVRLETSRNTETGGAGLGLAIVRDIIGSHGGEVSLEQSALGGLRVLITIPR